MPALFTSPVPQWAVVPSAHYDAQPCWVSIRLVSIDCLQNSLLFAEEVRLSILIEQISSVLRCAVYCITILWIRDTQTCLSFTLRLDQY